MGRQVNLSSFSASFCRTRQTNSLGLKERNKKLLRVVSGTGEVMNYSPVANMLASLNVMLVLVCLKCSTSPVYLKLTIVSLLVA